MLLKKDIVIQFASCSTDVLQMWDFSGLLFGVEIGPEWLMKWEAEN